MKLTWDKTYSWFCWHKLMQSPDRMKCWLMHNSHRFQKALHFIYTYIVRQCQSLIECHGLSKEVAFMFVIGWSIVRNWLSPQCNGNWDYVIIFTIKMYMVCIGYRLYAYNVNVKSFLRPFCRPTPWLLW